MTSPPITVEYVISLVQRLSPGERIRLRGALSTLDQPGAYHQQRQRNQAALDTLNALFFQVPPDSSQDDSWWSSFADHMNTERTAYRPLYPDHVGSTDAGDHS